MKRACIVLPTYNEAQNLPILIPSIFDQFSDLPTHELHVLVVEDRSPDGTANVVLDLQQTYPHLHLLQGIKIGLGDAYRRGFKHTLSTLKPDLVFQMDADLQHDPGLIPHFIRMINSGYNVVIGSRFVKGGATPGYSRLRRCQSRAGSYLIQRLMGVKGVRDCTSGYRCIDAGLLAKCSFEEFASDGFAFQSQLLSELIRKGAKVIEIPITFKRREHGHSKLTYRDRIDFLKNLMVFRFRRAR